MEDQPLNDESKGSEYVPLSASDPYEADQLNQAFQVSEECKTVSEVLQKAMQNSIVIPPELETATREFKTELQAVYMLNGKTEKIHDEKIAIKFANILGEIGNSLINHILQGESVIADLKVKGIVDNYVTSLDAALRAIPDGQDRMRDLIKDYIYLHFHCFKACYATNCLSFQ